MKDLAQAIENIENENLLYDLLCLGDNLSLLGCFEDANGVMDWDKIGEIISFIGREIVAKTKKIQKELALA